MRLRNFAIAAALLVLVLVMAGIEFFAGVFLLPRLQTAVNQSCGHCEFKIGSLEFGLFPPRAILGGVSYREGDRRDSLLGAQARLAVVPLPLSNLKPGPWRIGLIILQDVNVTLEESSEKFPKPPSAPKKDERFEFAGVLVRNAEFIYRNFTPAGPAVIQVHDISASAGPFCIAENCKNQAIDAHADARLENSGKVDLTVSAAFFADSPHVDVDLKLAGQDLKDVDPYFSVSDGIQLEGKLISARGVVKVRGTRGEGDALVNFANLGVHCRADRHRSGLLAFFENLGAKVKLKSANFTDPRSAKEHQVVTERHSGESVVSLILRTLKEAALRVAAK